MKQVLTGIGLAVVIAAIIIWLSSHLALADEAQCATLRSLNQQYRGVVLSASERVAKTQLVSWYRANCGKKPKRTQ